MNKIQSFITSLAWFQCELIAAMQENDNARFTYLLARLEHNSKFCRNTLTHRIIVDPEDDEAL